MPEGSPIAVRERYAPLMFVAALFLATATATRFILLGLHGALAAGGAGPAARALAAGARQDLAVTLWLGAPLALALTLLPARWTARRTVRWTLAAGLVLAVALALFVAVAEVLFFLEFDGRFNFVAVDYLIYPTEVAANIWQSYHTGGILLAIAAAALLAAPLARRAAAAGTASAPFARRAGVAAGYSAALALATVTLPSGVVSEDRALNEIGRSGYYTFWEALLGADAPYVGLYATEPPAEILDRLHHLLAEPATRGERFERRSTLRHVHAGGPPRPLNVVVVLEESFGSEYVGALHPGAPSRTPSFDRLTREGTLFTRAYSTGNRTIRALEAVTASIPPLPGISIVRRTASRDLFTLPGLLRERGYETTFIYGGRALFDGMGRYMRANGVDRIVEQSDFPADAFRTAWGVADEAIFDRTLAELDSLDAAGKPSFTLVLSVSNHRPYTYPAGRIAADPGQRKRGNAVQYADWALGRFMDQARRHRFYDHTLFVLMGDHGPRVYGAAEIPLRSYDVPILFVAPGVIPAGARIGTLASSLDVPATVLGGLGLDYDSRFFGRDLFRLAPDSGRALMTHNADLALLEGHRLAVLGLRGSRRVFRVEPEKRGLVAVDSWSAADSGLVDDAIAYFAGADLLYRTGRYHLLAPAAISTR